MTVEDDIQFERDGHVARIWLNRPHKRNCITVPMLHRLDEILQGTGLDELIDALTTEDEASRLANLEMAG